MRIVIDLQCLQTSSRYRGIGQYSRALVRQLLRHNRNLDEPHEYILLFNQTDLAALDELRSEWGELLDGVLLRTFQILPDCAELTTANPATVRINEVLRDHVLAGLEPDLVLVMSLFEGVSEPFVSAIPAERHYGVAVIGYDLIPLISPDQYLGDPTIRSWYYRKLDHLRRADLILAISHSARREFETYGQLPAHRVHNISTACDEVYRPLATDRSLAETHSEDAELRRLGLSRPFILYSGAADERKNLHGLLRAYAGLPPTLRQKHQLALVGHYKDNDRKHLERQIAALGIERSDIVFTGFISQETLNLLYNRCAVFVFPSFHEGFGLPVLEAISCGAPTLCANATSLPEVIGLDEAMFDPHDIEQMRARIVQALTDDNFRERLVAHGLQQARRFSWQQTAEAALDRMQAAHATRRADAVAPLDPIAAIADIVVATDVDDATLRRTANCLAANELLISHHVPEQTYRWRIEGPFDSSYSLALLNRETARALVALGQPVVLHSTEGPGDYLPDPAFLAANPDIRHLYEGSLKPPAPGSQGTELPQGTQPAQIVSRNLYPPRVNDMHGDIALLHHYAWEETRFPPDWVADFNRHLTGITCLSEHVRKVLIDNGVTLPLTVSGCGVDHWDRIKAEPFTVNARSYRFLHVSSCFPRKGIDALLAAWGQAFTQGDDVSLIIKTFANPHNDIEAKLAAQRAAQPDYPDVVLIFDDLPDAQLKGLYEQCHALVAPSKAEGFGLPLAEAMLSGLPVIATGWSGQLDFCSDDTAWLVDYRLEPAETHFELPSSLWANPDIDDLTRVLQTVYRAAPVAIEQRVSRAAHLLRDQFTWESVALRLIRQAGDIAQRRATEDLQRPLRLGWVSTWNQKCGLATYTEHLIEHCGADTVLVLAPEIDATLRPEDPATVIRCWRLDDRDSLERLGDTILAQGLDAVVFQANIYFYDYAALARLIARLKGAGIVVTITLHATFAPEPRKHLRELRPALEMVDRVIVHTARDINRLKEQGIVHNAVLIPHGILDRRPGAVEWPYPGRRCIASYGFALPHKGLEQLVDAFARLHQQQPDLMLLLLNAEHPDGSSAAFIRELQERINALGLQGSIYCDHRFLPDDESLGLLSHADVIAMPYQGTGESSSGAVKMALASGAPVMVTPLPIFDDVAPAVNFFDGQSVEDIEHGLRRALAGQWTRSTKDVARWKADHSYPVVAGRLFAMLRSLWINRPDNEAVRKTASSVLLDSTAQGALDNTAQGAGVEENHH